MGLGDGDVRGFDFSERLFLELMFLEISVFIGENVEEVFLKCVRIILNKIDLGEVFD